MNEVNKTQTDQSNHVGIEMVVLVVVLCSLRVLLKQKFDPRDPVTSAPDRRHASTRVHDQTTGLTNLQA